MVYDGATGREVHTLVALQSARRQNYFAGSTSTVFDSVDAFTFVYRVACVSTEGAHVKGDSRAFYGDCATVLAVVGITDKASWEEDGGGEVVSP